jgi:hypothetical protein
MKKQQPVTNNKTMREEYDLSCMWDDLSDKSLSEALAATERLLLEEMRGFGLYEDQAAQALAVFNLDDRKPLIRFAKSRMIVDAAIPDGGPRFADHRCPTCGAEYHMRLKTTLPTRPSFADELVPV